MIEYRRRLGLESHIYDVKRELEVIPESYMMQVVVEALLDIMRERDITYSSVGCRNYDFKLDIRPLEERND